MSHSFDELFVFHCANCKNEFFVDNAVEQLCEDCSEHGWIFIGPTFEDPTSVVFNAFGHSDKELEELPF